MTGLSKGQVPSQLLRGDGYRTTTPNERAVLNQLRVNGPLSRADVARATQLTKQSVMRIVDALVERGLIREGSPVTAGRGKPSTPLHLEADAAYSIGLSIMTDALTILLMDLSGAVRATLTEPMSEVRPEVAIKQIRTMIGRLIADARINRGLIIGTGVGITGYFIDSTARVNPPKQLDPWALIPLDSLLSEGLGMPVWIDNDGNVAAVGEAMVGAGRNVASFAYLFFSAGLGGGLYIDGRPVRGRAGNAGEFAAILPLDWPQPNLEQLRLRLNAAGGKFADLNQLLANFTLESPGLDDWMNGAIKSLSLVISSISAIVDPDLIILGGRMPPLLANAIIPRLEFVNPARRDHPRPVPMIVASRVLYDATAVGAASMPLRDAFFDVDG